MVLAAFLGVFLAMCVGGAVVLIRSDRKRATSRASGTAPHRYPLPSGTPVEVFVGPEAATQIARSAIQLVGAHDITILDDGSVVGWIGSSVTNIPGRAEYMVAVSRVIQPESSIVLGLLSPAQVLLDGIRWSQKRRTHSPTRIRGHELGL